MKFKGSYVVLICIWLDKPYFQEALQFAKILIKRYIEVMIDIMVWITPRWASELARLPPGDCTLGRNNLVQRSSKFQK